MIDLVYRRRQGVRLTGLALLVGGVGVAIGVDEAAGVALIGAAALVLALVQPLLLARMRSRQARRRAPRNGNAPGVGADDVDPRSF